MDVESQGLISLGLTATFSLLSKIAACTVAITGVLYAIGGVWSLEFYQALGAPWAAFMQSPTQILSRPGFLIGPLIPLNFAVLAHLDLNRQLRQDAHPKRMRHLWLVAMVGVFSLVLGAIVAGKLTGSKVHQNYLLACFVLLAMAGCWLTWAMVDVASTNVRGRERKMVVLGGAAFIVWFMALPVLAAHAAYHRFIDEQSDLPRATILDSPKGDWRIVGPLGDRLLLISAGPAENHSFRVVYPEALNNISRQ